VLIPARVELARARRVAAIAGVKLNDVVLATVTGALRDLAELLEEPYLPHRAMVPVSVRAEHENGGAGNRITFAFIDLPVDRPEAGERLTAVVSQMAKLKRSQFASGSDLLLRSVGMLPGQLKQGVARVASNPRTYSITVSNVPGPTMPLYAAGGRVLSVHPVIPISEGHSLSIGVVSYEGELHFGAYADPVALPDASELRGLIPLALERLELAVRRDRDHVGARRIRTRASSSARAEPRNTPRIGGTS
jgi:WS/DGAT/MGAT family acyltransferase